MSSARFDIQFAGELVPGTDQELARQHLQRLFKLSDTASERLFSGKKVTIKRAVDSDTVARYRERFREAGALIDAVPLATTDPVPDAAADAGQSGSTTPSSLDAAKSAPTAPDTSRLSLAPPGSWLEQPREVPSPEIDISHLSLVAGTDWTFEDCLPPPPRIRIPDISHLRLEPAELGADVS